VVATQLDEHFVEFGGNHPVAYWATRRMFAPLSTEIASDLRDALLKLRSFPDEGAEVAS
jgi:hypothetical protein